MNAKRLKNYKRAFVITLAIIVALLHFVIGPEYKGPFKSFLRGYLIDILLPFFLYFLFTLNVNQTWQKITVGAGIFVFGTVIELNICSIEGRDYSAVHLILMISSHISLGLVQQWYLILSSGIESYAKSCRHNSHSFFCYSVDIQNANFRSLLLGLSGK